LALRDRIEGRLQVAGVIRRRDRDRRLFWTHAVVVVVRECRPRRQRRRLAGPARRCMLGRLVVVRLRFELFVIVDGGAR
jgi:hypothetical protein